MNVRVLGCHGGASLHHRNVSFLIDDRLALDAGTLASALTVEEQARVRAVLVTHSHMDHVCDLGTLVEVRSQHPGEPLVIAGMRETIAALTAHYFNDVLWPDFAALQLPGGPVMELRELALGERVDFFGIDVLPIGVDHSVPSCGFVVRDGDAALAYSGDTGPTDRFWAVLHEVANLRYLITEVSFPDRLAELAEVSGHLTPRSFSEQLAKCPRREGLEILVYGIKPSFEEEVLAEIRALGRSDVRTLRAGETLQL